MTPDEQNLLLVDLCGRLPYDIEIQDEYGDYINVNIYNAHIEHLIDRVVSGLDKMVLRPMSSMTEEECDMVETILGDENIFDFMRNGDIILKEGKFTQIMLGRLHDYFNSIHVDYRGLIPKGLANEAPEGMYENK